MFDLRIYRTALIPAVAALALMMFSFEPASKPLQPPVTSPVFEGTDAARAARGLLSAAPDLTPGSPGDRAAGDLVRESFAAVEGGIVTEQDVEVPFGGEDVADTNIVLTLPGSTDRTVVVLAPRNAPSDAYSGSAAAATATLTELAGYLGDSRHAMSIVLASVAGGDGAAGTRALLESLEGTPIESALVINQPSLPQPEPPFVTVPAGGEGVSPQLVETAREIASARFQEPDTAPGPWRGLAELAFPESLGEAAALQEEGVQALAIGAGGERLVPSGLEQISATSLTASGGSVLELVLTLDEGQAPEAGPSTHLRLGDNLVPGWTIALFALSLLIAPLISSVDTWARSLRADWRTRRTAFWAAERVLVPLGALLLVGLLGLVGLIPDPAYPFEPSLFQPGSSALVVLCLLAAAAILVALLIRPMRTPLDSEPHTLAAAAGFLTTLGVLGVWAFNPFLALLLALTAHVWVLPARASGPPRPWVVTLVCLLSLVPALIAFLTSTARLDLDPLEASWAYLLMIADGGVALLPALCWCLVLGGLLACVSSAGSSGGADDGLSRRRRPGGAGAMPLAPIRGSVGSQRVQPMARTVSRSSGDPIWTPVRND